MEDNRSALAQLQSGRGGLPHYHDLGRFCCMAVGLHTGGLRASRQLQLRPAAPSDLSALIAFLNREGPKHQFSPIYAPEDLDHSDGLLPDLIWENIILAWQGSELVGVAAAWDQRRYRRWRVTGYAPWLRVLRLPLNAMATFRRLPRFPAPGIQPDYFMLSLVCINNHDAHVFQALLDEIIVRHRDRFDFFVAGLHERDPLMPALRAYRHVSMPSRLFAVAWEDGTDSVDRLRPELVPCLEIGAL
jgi:hypothetical protein